MEYVFFNSFLLFSVYCHVSGLSLVCLKSDRGKWEYHQILERNEDMFEINKRFVSKLGLQGGDILPERGRNTVLDQTFHWTSTIIPISLSADLSNKARFAIQLSIEDFRLRTCINFVTRTIESDYIVIEPLSGCYSIIGRTSGAQTLSIGSGCETMGIVSHELMHALGILHEQSRADRNDYVTIQTANIDNSFISNFGKVSWTHTTARREPYDYNSIMHYSSTTFSNNGNPTITTKDSTFQSAIGQISTFTKSDSTKINRMYNCSDTVLLSYNCNFEDTAICGYVKDYVGDDKDWLRFEIGTTSVTSPGNPPTTDATYGIANKGSYILLDTSDAIYGQSGQLRSMRLLTRSVTQCLQFYYYLYKGSTSSMPSLTIYVAQLNSQTGEIIDLGNPVATLTDASANYWRFLRVTVSAPSPYRLVFQATTGSSSNDVIAVDDVNIQDKSCETAYFVIDDFNTILNSAVNGVTDVTSERLYTSEGYAFVVKVFPRGHSDAPGYTSIYFGLVQGTNDASLSWPFLNRYVRLMIVDQNPDAKYAKSKYNGFLTEEVTRWQQPAATGGVLVGYPFFITINELSSSLNFLKGGRLIVSILIMEDGAGTGSTTSASSSSERLSGALNINLCNTLMRRVMCATAITLFTYIFKVISID